MCCFCEWEHFENWRLISYFTLLFLQVCHPWSLCWLLPERRTSQGSACFCVKLSWLFISPCSFMVWAHTAAMNSSAWQHILSTTACGLLFLGEGPKSLLSQRGLSFHQVNLLLLLDLLTLFPFISVFCPSIILLCLLLPSCAPFFHSTLLGFFWPSVPAINILYDFLNEKKV